MRFVKNYLKENLKWLLLVLACFGILCFVIGFEQVPLAQWGYAAFLCFFLFLLVVIIDFTRRYLHHKKLEKQTSEIAVTMDKLSLPQGQMETDYQKMLRSLYITLQQQINELENGQVEQAEYFTMWVHQIKTPIASMHLILQKEDSENSRRLRAELFRVEQYVRMVLCFLRLDSDFTDYVIKEYKVDNIVRSAVRSLAPQFIMKRLALEYEQTDVVALTDEKWLGFVVEQVLSNAVKYTSAGSISIKCDEDRLVISDTGIGIAAEDLPRIFDKGYTGFNGRADRKASGIGLYLCRRICDKLGHSIRAESVAGQGTTITIGLGRNRLEVE